MARISGILKKHFLSDQVNRDRSSEYACIVFCPLRRARKEALLQSHLLWFSSAIVFKVAQGRIQGGGGVLGVSPPPLYFWEGTPKLHKEGEKTLHPCAQIQHVLVVNSYPDPPPPPPPLFRNLVSAPVAPKCPGQILFFY